MEVRRATYEAAIKLAFVFSAVAAMVTIALDSMGEVSSTRLVFAVAIIGFAASWFQTGRVARAAAESRHRVTIMPLRQPIN